MTKQQLRALSLAIIADTLGDFDRADYDLTDYEDPNDGVPGDGITIEDPRVLGILDRIWAGGGAA